MISAGRYPKSSSNVFLQCSIYMHAPVLTIQDTRLGKLILLSFVLVNLEVFEGIGILGGGNDTTGQSVYGANKSMRY